MLPLPQFLLPHHQRPLIPLTPTPPDTTPTKPVEIIDLAFESLAGATLTAEHK